ncbi:MAG: hypothetical protein RIF33_22565 [Cyclobacteriaceae bacterium]
MTRIVSLLLITLSPLMSLGQALTYENQSGDIHLAGEIQLSDLQNAPYQEWYNENYRAFEKSDKPSAWSKNLKEAKVEIFLGTWCGDSKMWVPRFINLWESLGLDTSQLKIVALYDGAENYKQGPEGEEKGRNIHRVPTFIFSRDGEEFARIVESPVNELETDLAQIALGYASAPNYRGATAMIELLATKSDTEIKDDMKTHLNAVYRKAGRSVELNTLGYVYLRSGRVREAIMTFMFNTRFFPYDPNVYDSYAEALEQDGQIALAIENYQKVLEINPDNEKAREKVEALSDQQ